MSRDDDARRYTPQPTCQECGYYGNPNGKRRDGEDYCYAQPPMSFGESGDTTPVVRALRPACRFFYLAAER